MTLHFFQRLLWRDGVALYPDSVEIGDQLRRLRPQDILTVVCCPASDNAWRDQCNRKYEVWRTTEETRWINLEAGLAEIERSMSATTRWCIRQVEKNAAEVRFEQNSDRLADDFRRLFNGFASTTRVVRRIARPELKAMRRDCEIAGVYLGRSLMAAHVCLADYKLGRICLLRSVSARHGVPREIATLAGNLNRWLHWREIQIWLNAGFSCYDLGGLGAGSKSLDAISDFKRSLGGQTVPQERIVFAGAFGRTRLKGLRMFRRLPAAVGHLRKRAPVVE